jgi:hypothetical protein
MTSPAAHKWAFAPRFRLRAFGWRSQSAVQRVRGAAAEIQKLANKDPALAAAGAVLFLEKVSPALEQVHSPERLRCTRCSAEHSGQASGSSIAEGLQASTACSDAAGSQRWERKLARIFGSNPSLALQFTRHISAEFRIPTRVSDDSPYRSPWTQIAREAPLLPLDHQRLL